MLAMLSSTMYTWVTFFTRGSVLYETLIYTGHGKESAYNARKVKVKSLSRVRLFATPWTGAYQAPPSMGFSRQECWSGLPFPSPGDLPNPGIEPRSPAFQAGFNLWATREWVWKKSLRHPGVNSSEYLSRSGIARLHISSILRNLYIVFHSDYTTLQFH